jgi:type IV pilus assembly protein PilV
MRTNKHQAGVMLIEALIGILIFSIGILALLGMQGAAIKNTTDARYRSEAAYFANQILGQMWVDDNNQLARYDTANPAAYLPRDTWVNTVAARLPGVTIGGALSPTIQVGPGAGLVDREVRVQVQWRQPGDTDPLQIRNVVILNRIHTGSGI